MWTTENTLQLIEDVHSTPCLWDMKCVDYKNRSQKGDAMNHLAIKYGVSCTDIEKKMHSLRSQFRRERKKLADSKRNGCSPRESSWFGYEPLLFLLQGTESRQNRSTHASDTPDKIVEEENEGDDDTDGDVPEKKLYRSQENGNRPRKKLKNEGEIAQEAIECMRMFTETVLTRDPFSVYGEHVANKLRSCGRNNIEISIAQHNIDNILFNLSMGIYDKEEICSNSRIQ